MHAALCEGVSTQGICLCAVHVQLLPFLNSATRLHPNTRPEPEPADVSSLPPQPLCSTHPNSQTAARRALRKASVHDIMVQAKSMQQLPIIFETATGAVSTPAFVLSLALCLTSPCAHLHRGGYSCHDRERDNETGDVRERGSTTGVDCSTMAGSLVTTVMQH